MVLERARNFFVASAGLLLICSQGAVAWDSLAVPSLPDCPAFALKTQNSGVAAVLPVNNDQVLAWKTSTQNQYTNRGHVQGNVAKVYPDRNGHEHFAIQIGAAATDTVEIIYNQDFGAVPAVTVGIPVEACGDYITSIGPSPGPGGQTYPASPDGALVHWVHMAPGHSGHNSGYLVVGGVLTGQAPGNAGSGPHHGEGFGYTEEFFDFEL